MLYGASLNITRSTFRDNTAITGPGGGVFAQGSGTRMFVGTSTFYNHHAGGYGGSIAALYFARTDVEVRRRRGPACPANANISRRSSGLL